MENEIFEMLNLGTLEARLLLIPVKVDLENVIISQIHKDDSGMDTSLENILGNLQTIFQNYEYVVPDGDSEDDNPFFRVAANLSPINSSFGTLNLTIGHTVSYKEEQIENIFGELTTQKVVDKLSLTYMRGSFNLVGELVKLNFQLTLAQNWEDYVGDAKYFVQNRTVWNAYDHAPKP